MHARVPVREVVRAVRARVSAFTDAMPRLLTASRLRVPGRALHCGGELVRRCRPVTAARLQGWRTSMEDAHCAELDVDGKGSAFFGVYDGRIAPLECKTTKSIFEIAHADIPRRRACWD